MAITGLLTIVFPARSSAAKEQASYAIPVEFQDESGELQTPTAMAWGLSAGLDLTVNSRTDVQIASPASEQTVVLTPDDLDISDGSKRYLTITAEYDSDDLGDGLIVTGEETFTITDFTGDIPAID